MKLFSIVISLLFLEQALAFLPAPTRLAPWGYSKVIGTSQHASSMDENFDGVDLVKLLGKKQLQRMKRRRDAQKAKPSTPPPKQASASSGKIDPVKIIIAGAPASGKGTQCEQIKAKYGVVHLSTGDMLREAVAAGTAVGKEAKEYMDSGKLVPDEVIIGVVKDRLMEKDCQTKGWLLDGFPRTQAQAKALKDEGIMADCFVFLNVPDEMLVERVVGRRTDPETGKIYHMTFSPPENEEVKARLVQRSDDTEEKVKVRLVQFHDNVDAVKDSYDDISVTIEGAQSPDQVSKDIFDAISSKVGKRVAS